MQITEEEAKIAGKLADNISWTDKELALVIKTTKLVIAYMEGRGPTWQRDTVWLYRELSSFNGFVATRKRG